MRPGRHAVWRSMVQSGAAVILAVGIAACGAAPAEPVGAQPSDPVEKTTVKVAVGDPFGASLFQLGGATGLAVDVMVVPDTQTRLTGLADGTFDMAQASYVPLIEAAAAGRIDVRIVADGFYAQPDMAKIVVSPNSRVTSASGLAGMRVAFASGYESATLLAADVLRTSGVDPAAVRWVERPASDLAGALTSGAADAAVLVEPYLTMGQLSTGTVAVTDATIAASGDFPLDAFVLGSRWARQRPNTVATIQWLMSLLAHNWLNRIDVDKELARSFGPLAQYAPLAALPAFHGNVNLARAQRVADRLRELGRLTATFDASTVLALPGTRPGTSVSASVSADRVTR